MLRAVVVILLVSLLVLESFQASVKVDAGGKSGGRGGRHVLCTQLRVRPL